MIYIISCNEKFIKIGYSTTGAGVWDRIDNFQVGNPYPLTLVAMIDGDQEKEKRIHDYLKSKGFHERGEWFCRYKGKPGNTAPLEERIIKMDSRGSFDVGQVSSDQDSWHVRAGRSRVKVSTRGH